LSFDGSRRRAASHCNNIERTGRCCPVAPAFLGTSRIAGPLGAPGRFGSLRRDHWRQARRQAACPSTTQHTQIASRHDAVAHAEIIDGRGTPSRCRSGSDSRLSKRPKFRGGILTLKKQTLCHRNAVSVRRPICVHTFSAGPSIPALLSVCCDRSVDDFRAWRANQHATREFFGCRRCRGLVYGTQQESPYYRNLTAAQKIRARLGGSLSTFDEFPDKPKRMHRRTYLRLKARGEKVEAACMDLTKRWLSRTEERRRAKVR